MTGRWVVLLGLLLGSAAAGAQTPAVPPGFTMTPVFDNATVGVVRLVLAPGAREQPHTHQYAMLVIFLSRGEVDMHNGSVHTRQTRKPGEIEFVKPGTTHFAANVGTTPLDALVLSIKPDRARAASAPPPRQSQPGVTRTPLADNTAVTVAKFEFDPDVRESVHTHPYDLLLVPTTPARLDLQVGDTKTVRGYAVGEAIWIPRDTRHALANVGTSSFRLLGIVVK